MTNVADDPAFAEVRMRLETRLLDELARTGDPRLVNDGSFYETPPMAGPLATPQPTEEAGQESGHAVTRSCFAARPLRLAS